MNKRLLGVSLVGIGLWGYVIIIPLSVQVWDLASIVMVAKRRGTSDALPRDEQTHAICEKYRILSQTYWQDDVFAIVSAAVRDVGVVLLSFVENESKPLSFGLKTPCKVSIEGDFFQLLRFLECIYESDMCVVPTSFTMQRTEKMNWRFDVSLSGYVVKNDKKSPST